MSRSFGRAAPTRSVLPRCVGAELGDWLFRLAHNLARRSVLCEMCPSTALLHGVPFVLAGVVVATIDLRCCAIQARSTVYTLTNKRVCMRIGAALTMTLNLPYVCIAQCTQSTVAHGRNRYDHA